MSDLLQILNRLLDELGIVIPEGITHINDLTPTLLIAILECLLRTRLDLPLSARARDLSSRIAAIKVFLGTLAADVLCVDLSHISPRKVALGDDHELQIIAEYLVRAATELGFLRELGHPETPPSFEAVRRASVSPPTSTAPTTIRTTSREDVVSYSSVTTVRPSGRDVSPTPYTPTPRRDRLQSPTMLVASEELSLLFQGFPPLHAVERRSGTPGAPRRQLSASDHSSDDDHPLLEDFPPLGMGSGPVKSNSKTARHRRRMSPRLGQNHERNLFGSESDEDPRYSGSSADSEQDKGGDVFLDGSIFSKPQAPPRPLYIDKTGYIEPVDDVPEFEASHAGHTAGLSPKQSKTPKRATRRISSGEHVLALLQEKAQLLERIAQLKIQARDVRADRRERSFEKQQSRLSASTSSAR